MNPIFHVAITHLMSRKRQMAVSLMGIVLGVGFFLAVSSLMQGSELDFIRRLVDNTPHITLKDEVRAPPTQPVITAYPKAAVTLRRLKPQDDQRGIRNYKERLMQLSDLEGVKMAAVLSGSVVVSYAGRERGATITGLVPQAMRGVSPIERLMVTGTLDELSANTDGVIVGKALAEKFNFDIGNNLTVTAPNGTVRLMKVVGFFKSGNKGYDEGQLFALLKKVQSLLNRPNTANRFIFKLEDPYQAGSVAKLIEGRTGGYLAESWQETSADVMRTLAVRNTIMYSVVSAILVVAAFGIYNIISTIVMEKTRDIAILKSIGFRALDIQKIFLIQGGVLGFIGSALGCLLGSGMIFGLNQIKIKTPFSTDALPMPVDWSWPQFALAVSCAIAASLFAAWLPARKASRVQPVTILRGAA
jgi:lipoprotein-releasing system permease protein